MAEPISVVGLAASIVQLIGATVKAYKYLNDVKNAPKERARLSLEAANLVPLLDALRDQVENADPSDPWIHNVLELGGPTGPLELFKRTMEQLKGKLKTESPMLKMGKHLVWTLSKDDIHKILSDIERFKTRLIVALQNDNMNLSRAIKKDTSAILPLQENVSGIKADTTRIEPLGTEVRNVSADLNSLNARMSAQANSWLTENTLSWLTPLDFSRHHNSEIEDRTDGTGQWFLDSPEFVRWRDGHEETLFAGGIPGAGKTIIASLAIDYLHKAFFNDSSIVVLYAYCFYKDQSQQTLANMIAGLLKQLIQTLRFVPDQIRNLHESCKQRNVRPTEEDLSKALISELRGLRKVYIVVDALDEYSHSEAAKQSLLGEIQKLRIISNLMITSRYISPFMDAFSGAIQITVSADVNDVRRYLESQMPTLPKCIRNKPALQELIVRTITEAVDGMFLLARLHVRSLMDKVNKRKVEEALRALPKGSGPAASDFAYDETVHRIKSQEPGFRDLAFTALSWISLAYRPLTITELLYALSIEPGDTAIDEENLIDEHTLTFICAGFVVIDKSNHSIRLAHYTMQEYFDRRRHDLFEDADTDIAITCITYLLFDEFSTYTEKDLEKIENDFERSIHHLEEHPLLDYAANYWGCHVVHSDGNATRALCLELLGHHVKLAASVTTIFPNTMSHQYPGDNGRYIPWHVHGLSVAARFGLDDLLDELLDAEDLSTPTAQRRASDAICEAASCGNRETVELLIEKTNGSIVVAEGSRALHCAVRCGQVRCMTTLLEAGADVNADDVDSCGLTPLNLAAGVHGAVSLRMAELLIAAGADVEGNGYSPLSFAVNTDNIAVARLLLGHDADASGTSMGPRIMNPSDRVLSWTPLHSARSSAMVELLVQYGANANATDANGSTPLHYVAAHHTPLALSRIDQMLVFEDTTHAVAVSLIQNGASALQRDTRNRTPLHWATWEQDFKIVRLLLESGAEVNAKDDVGFPALAYAHICYWQWKGSGLSKSSLKLAVAIEALLIEFGADTDALADELLIESCADTYALADGLPAREPKLEIPIYEDDPIPFRESYSIRRDNILQPLRM